MSPRGDLAVIISARNESDRVGATVRAAARIAGADLVIVVDDGSTDGTAAIAAGAGAVVTRHARTRGKAAAMETGAETVRVIEADRADGPARHLLFLDADLADSAGFAGPLAEPVRSGAADMTIAVFADRVKLGGHGFVLGLASAGTERLTGWRPADLLGKGMVVREVTAPLAHRATGADLAAQVHRARQFAGVAAALAARHAWRRAPVS